MSDYDSIRIRRTVIVNYKVTPRELRRGREESGASLRKFSSFIGVSCSYWSKVERGQAKPGDSVLKKAIVALWGMKHWLAVKSAATVETE